VRDPTREEQGYQPGITNIGKTPQLVRDIPQAVTIVPEQLMFDRNADSFREALRNVPSLTFNAGEGGRIGDNITLRGYSAVGDLYLDGMRDIAQYNRETFNLTQIEVLRGSASMLFGRGSTGGVINQVSKTPFLTDRGSLALTLGNHQYSRMTLDANKKTGENEAFRLNLMTTESGSGRDAESVTQRRWGFAPSYSWGIGTQDEVTIAYYRLKDDNVPDYGVPYFQGRPLNVAGSTFYGLATNRENNDTEFMTATWIHRFSNDTNLKSVLRKANYFRELRAVAPRIVGTPIVITDATGITRQSQARGGEEHTVTSQTDLNTKFDTGGIKHQLLVGFEYAYERAERWNYTGINNPNGTVGNPNPYVAYTPLGTRTGQASYKGSTQGFYAQDMMEFAKGWKWMVGARYDIFGTDYDRPPPAGPLARRDKTLSYRTGLIYQPSDTASYYASYGTSFNPSAELYQLDDRTTNTDPESSRNIEIGAKYELFDGNLSLRGALFRTEKLNERNTDLANATVSVLSGRRHTDGVELEWAGRINANWDVFGAVSFMTANIDAASGGQAGTLGKRPINTPSRTFNFWSTYKLGDGWRVGGGIDGVGNRFGDQNNANLVPGYTRVDALVEYAQPKYTVKLNALNLLNKTYYEGVYAGHVLPGNKRSVQMTFEMKF
jgi:catecholate siderophore receptor